MPIIKGKNFIFQKLWVKDIDYALICERIKYNIAAHRLYS